MNFSCVLRIALNAAAKGHISRVSLTKSQSRRLTLKTMEGKRAGVKVWTVALTDLKNVEDAGTEKQTGEDSSRPPLRARAHNVPRTLGNAPVHASHSRDFVVRQPENTVVAPLQIVSTFFYQQMYFRLHSGRKVPSVASTCRTIIRRQKSHRTLFRAMLLCCPNPG